ncbi:MAG: tetratricopeptide repeat protein, partial [Promethearchaeota archaeon]
QCLGIDRELGNREGEGLLLGRMGECYSQMGQYNKALDSLQFSLKIARETGNREREEELIALIREVNKAMAQR